MPVINELRWQMMEQRPEWSPPAQGLCPHCHPPAVPIPSLMAEDKPQSMMFGDLPDAIASLAHAILTLAREVSLHNQAGGLKCRLAQIDERLKIMAATQQELAADLRTVVEQQKKTQLEIQTVQAATNVLKEKVKELEDIIANNPEAAAIPELVQAVADVKNQAQIVDDELPDLVASGQAASKPRPVP